MSDLAIRVENLGKQYKIGARIERYATLRDSITRVLAHPLRRARNKKSGEDCLWALRDVSLEIKHGEIVGIIGRNGAGKTTLLKILSRITEPTQGRAEIYGRVGSLLEVGTGFHPELTGRENIYLNGAILGMRKAEIDRKFDEIVDFAEVEKFLDTPVKRYSSGMYVRLAFAVAANLEPDILMVDEVLAVGDVAFQKKCLGKMGEVSREGRTILFVSHNISAIRQLCSKAVMLDSGHLVCQGSCEFVIQTYLGLAMEENNLMSSIECTRSMKRSGTGSGKIVKIQIESHNGQKTATIGIGEPLCLKVYAELHEELPSLVVGAEVKSQQGIPILNLRSDSQGYLWGPYKKGSTVLFTLKIPSLPFYPGIYKIEPWLAEKKGKRIDHFYEGIMFMLVPIGKFKSEYLIQLGKGLMIMDFECNCKVLFAQ
jgi:lipopolysaccharide transport system ATP-binding protein